MNNTTTRILGEEYDAGLGIGDPTAILWAAEKAAEEIGTEAAKKELKKINRVREKYGKIPVYAPYGHRLF